MSNRLIDQIGRTTWGAVIGHGFAAFVQEIVAGVGLYFIGILNVFFRALVMFVLAFLPLISAFLVWALASVYPYLIGNTVEGVLLAIYGLLIVSMINYYARPLVIDRRARLNLAVLLIGVFVATVRTIQEDYNEI